METRGSKLAQNRRHSKAESWSSSSSSSSGDVSSSSTSSDSGKEASDGSVASLVATPSVKNKGGRPWGSGSEGRVNKKSLPEFEQKVVAGDVEDFGGLNLNIVDESFLMSLTVSNIMRDSNTNTLTIRRYNSPGVPS